MITADEINQFFSFLSTGEVGRVMFWVQIAMGVIVSAFLAAIMVIMLKFRELLAARAPSAPGFVPAPAVKDPWQEVMKNIESANASDWHLAVIRADSILDAVLKDKGLAGETMGERLKQIDRSRLASLDAVWEAHKLRNRIAHDTDRVLSYQEARRAVMLFSEGLRELGYLKE